VLDAVQAQDNDALGKALLQLEGIFGVEPSHLDSNLSRAADSLPLPELRDTLRNLEMVLKSLQMNVEDSERLEEFSSSLEDVDQLQKNLEAMVSNHRCLQQIENELRSAALRGIVASSEIVDLWKAVQPAFHALQEAAPPVWMEKLVKAGNALDDAIAKSEVDMKEDARRAAAEKFRTFRFMAAAAFSAADDDLKGFCDELKDARDALNELLGSMHYGIQ